MPWYACYKEEEVFTIRSPLQDNLALRQTTIAMQHTPSLRNMMAFGSHKVQKMYLLRGHSVLAGM